MSDTFLPEGKYIKNYGKDYKIFPDGRIVSCEKKCWNGKSFWVKKEAVLKPCISKCGYKTVSLRRKSYYLHRLLLEAFVRRPAGKNCVNHKDGNKLNNDLYNLEWCTYSENSKHAFKTGLMKVNPCFGESNPANKIKEVEVREIIGLKNKQKLKETAAQYKLSITQVWAIQNRKSWAHLKAD